jgi:hypothetical protein
MTVLQDMPQQQQQQRGQELLRLVVTKLLRAGMCLQLLWL